MSRLHRDADPRLHGAARTLHADAPTRLSAGRRARHPAPNVPAFRRRLPCRHSRRTGRSRRTTRPSSSRFVDMELDDLDAGDVVIRTKYSTINYKDALSYNGAGKIMRKYPTNRRHRHGGNGRDVGTITRWKRGDKVIVHALRPRRVAHDGGYAEYVRVPGRLDRAPAREHDGVRRDDARHRRLHRGAGDHADGAQRPQARQRTGRRSRARPAASAPSRSRSWRRAATTSSRSPAKKEARAICKDLGAKEVLLRQSIDSRSITPARQGDVGGRDRQPRRRHARRGCSSTIEDRRHRRPRSASRRT